MPYKGLPGGRAYYRTKDAYASQSFENETRQKLDALDTSLGTIGEYVESVAAEGSVGTWVDNTGKTITSISLTTGTWDVAAFGSFAGGAITGTASAFSISTVANTIQAADKSQTPSVPTATSEVYLSVMPRRISLTTTTTIYLVGLIKFSGGTPTAGGTLRATRALAR